MHQFQNDITTHMRGILLDWLVEVAEEYSLAQYTLALACNYVDRFISQVHVSRNSLQLVGIGCMMIAAYVLIPFWESFLILVCLAPDTLTPPLSTTQ
jgi:hypothetical protein